MSWALGGTKDDTAPLSVIKYSDQLIFVRIVLIGRKKKGGEPVLLGHISLAGNS